MKFATLAVTGFLVVAFSGYKSYTAFNAPIPVETVVVSTPSSTLLNTTNRLPAVKTLEKHNVDQARVVYLDAVVEAGSANEVAKSILELNSKSSADIWLLINSPGGSVLDGATLISVMQASKAHINTVCTGLCASMAAVIHSYGYKRYAVDRSILMYHPASGGAQGQIPNMLSQLGTITSYIDEMTSNIVGRSHMDRSEFDKRVSYEMWLEANEATKLGFNDQVISLSVPLLQLRGSLSLGGEQEDQPEPVTISPSTPSARFEWISPHRELWTFIK